MSVTSFIKGIGRGRGRKKIVRRPRMLPRGDSAKPKEKTTLASAGHSTHTAKRVGLTVMMTEKAVGQQLQQHVVFRVAPHATKSQIAQAVFEHYKVRPRSIRTSRVAGKRRTRGRTIGFTAAWKKAYVTVSDVKDLKLAP
jgi:large subunit ribosomal protein L23